MQKVMIVLGILAVSFLSVSVGTAAAQDEKSVPGLQIMEARLGTAIEAKNIIGEAAVFTLGERVYVWMKVTGGTGDSIDVSWNQGTYSYRTTLTIGGSPWRTWSYKTASIAGEWTVTISDSKGTVLKEIHYTVEKPR